MKARISVIAFIASSIASVTRATQSSLNALPGDQLVAPLDRENREPPGDKVTAPLNTQQADEAIAQAKAEAKAKSEEITAAAEELQLAALAELSAQPEPPAQLEEKASEQLFKEAKELAAAKPEPQPSTPLRPRPAKPRRVERFQSPEGKQVSYFKTNMSRNDDDYITLPAGAHTFGMVKFGEEVTASKGSEVLISLDYAFLGPNDAVVELKGCVVWAKVQSNFHTQKVMGNMSDLTCTSPSGKVWTVDVAGPLVGAASGYAGVGSDLIMKGPAKAAALKFLAEITKAYGAATSAAQLRTDIVAGDKTSEKASNVEGNKDAFIRGKVIEAHGDFLTYISSFFSSMQPTLALPPGTKVHLVNRYNVAIPKSFFRTKESKK